MFGEACCTFIPNNTAPDGSVTRALAGLRSLSLELAENAGVEDMMSSWLSRMFGKWKGVFTSIISVLITVIAVFAFCGCCIIPCITAVISKVLAKALVIEGQEMAVLLASITRDEAEEMDG